MPDGPADVQISGELRDVRIHGVDMGPLVEGEPGRPDSPSYPVRECLLPVLLDFSGELWFWRGPAPWYFVTVPEESCRELQAISGFVSYGWGMIPVSASLGRSTWRTSLFPKDGRYLLPVKAQVRRAERVAAGDTVTIQVAVDT